MNSKYEVYIDTEESVIDNIGCIYIKLEKLYILICLYNKII